MVPYTRTRKCRRTSRRSQTGSISWRDFAAWDFGLLPYAATVAEIRRPDWREAVDACRLLTSPAYHLLRSWHGLPALPYIGQQLAYIRDDPSLAYI